ncbi:hypothetical protein CHARACLAT_030214, partial [Characodon lateralis]|nr:hypothetical protein [Characodon lateralis]
MTYLLPDCSITGISGVLTTGMDSSLPVRAWPRFLNGQRSSQESHGNSGGAAEINSSHRRIKVEEITRNRNFPDPHIFERGNSEFRSQSWSKQDKNIRMSYEWIVSIENLNDVPNPWKGFTMNRCLVVALAVLLVSSGVKEVQEALDYFVEETGIMSLIDCLQTGSLPQ